MLVNLNTRITEKEPIATINIMWERANDNEDEIIVNTSMLTVDLNITTKSH